MKIKNKWKAYAVSQVVYGFKDQSWPAQIDSASKMYDDLYDAIGSDLVVLAEKQELDIKQPWDQFGLTAMVEHMVDLAKKAQLMEAIEDPLNVES